MWFVTNQTLFAGVTLLHPNPSLVSLLLHVVCVAPHACKGLSNYQSNTCTGLIWRKSKLWSQMLSHLWSSWMIACISCWYAAVAPARCQHKYDDTAHHWIVVNQSALNIKHPERPTKNPVDLEFDCFGKLDNKTCAWKWRWRWPRQWIITREVFRIQMRSFAQRRGNHFAIPMWCRQRFFTQMPGWLIVWKSKLVVRLMFVWVKFNHFNIRVTIITMTI